MNFNSCGGTCSDSVGNLLFYSNGLRIFNINHQLMEGGDTINPGSVWNNSNYDNDGYYTGTSPFALPLPNSSNIYYLIHEDIAFPLGAGTYEHLYYTVIDMNANNGLGKVVAKNQILLQGNLIWVAAVKHGNGRDWWIMSAQKSDPKHYLFLLSPQGISGPYIQDIGPPFNSVEYVGESLFSEDGKYYLRHDSNKALRIYGFDRCTGLLSNLRIVPFQEGLHPWYAAFSPNSRFLYLSRPGWVWSLDLQAPDLSASFDTVATWELNYYPSYPWVTGYFLNQLGPDGKIYWNHYTGGSKAMNVMHRPDMPGDASDCEEVGFYLPRWNGTTINQFPNYRLGEWDNAPCDTLNGQKPGDGFASSTYDEHQKYSDNHYSLLKPIPVASCADCSTRDLEMLNNQMAFIHALMEKRISGRTPADWPSEKAEREGIFLLPPPRKK